MLRNHIALNLPGMELAFPTETHAVLHVAHVALIAHERFIYC